MENPSCACGCGKIVRLPRHRFCHGHNFRPLGPWNKGKQLPAWVVKKLSIAAKARRDTPEVREIKRQAQLKRWAKVSQEDRVLNLSAARTAFQALPKHVRRAKLARGCQNLRAISKEVRQARLEYARTLSRLTPSFTESRFLDRVEAAIGMKVFRQVKINGFSLDGLVKDVDIEVDGDYWHSRPGVTERDRKRDAAFSRIGLKIVRIKASRTDVGFARVCNRIVAFINGDVKKS